MGNTDSIVLNTNSAVIREDMNAVIHNELPWENLERKKILLTGAAGMLGAYIAETLLTLPYSLELYALVRNPEKAQKRFSRYLSDPRLHLIKWDLSQDLPVDFPKCNIVIHYGSIPRPDNIIPVDVAEPNITGTWKLLEYARSCPDFEQFLFCSSCGIYGNCSTGGSVKESVAVQVNPLEIESCYTISKIAGEHSCILFDSQYNIPCKILRYAHTYGPGVDLNNDVRSFAFFLQSVLRNQDITLNSSGKQKRCFCYIADATEAFFRVLLKGERKNAYNIAAPENKISILDLALFLAGLNPEKKVKVKVCQEKVVSGFVPLNAENEPDIGKLQELGFTPKISIEEGFRRTLSSYSINFF